MTATEDLNLNTVSHFLDRFVYKNPKRPKPRGMSAMQPSAAPQDGGTVRLVRGSGQSGNSGVVVNDDEFWKAKAGDVPVDKVRSTVSRTDPGC